jgi:hypothetical protein
MATAYAWALAEPSPLASLTVDELRGGADVARDLLSTPDGAGLELVDGDLALAYGLEAIAQDVRQALELVRGEWFLDEEAGTPWFQDVLGQKQPNLAIARASLVSRILGRKGVKELVSFDMSFDSASRALSVSFEVSTDVGELSLTVSLPGLGGV